MVNKTNKTQRVFQCHKCSHVFNAEDSSDLKCPKCGSDNIDEKKKKNNLLLPKIIVFLLAVAIGYFVTPILVPKPSSTGNQEEIQPLPPLPSTPEPGDSTPIDTPSVEKVEEVKEILVPITVNCEAPVNVNGKYIYSLTAKCNYAGKAKVEYHLLETSSSTEPLMKSENGQFAEIPPAKNPEGFYWLYAFVTEENRSSDTIRVEGFKKRPVEVLRKVTAAEVVAMLNKKEAATKNSMYFSKPIQIHAEGRTFNDLRYFEKHLSMKRLTVESAKLEYNSQNKVTSITVTYVNN